MLKDMNMTRRHERLAQRPRCGEVWPADSKDAEGHAHACNVVANHIGGNHICVCGRTRLNRKRRRIGRLGGGAAVLFLVLASAALGDESRCPGGFPLEIARASKKMTIERELYVQVAENSAAPSGNTSSLAAEAWVPRASIFDGTIFIRYDVIHAMGCAALKGIATHEVCHIAAFDWASGQYTPMSVALEQERKADLCVQQFLSPAEYRAYRQDQWETTLFLRKNPVEPVFPLHPARVRVTLR